MKDTPKTITYRAMISYGKYPVNSALTASLKWEAEMTNHRRAEQRSQERNPEGLKSAAEEKKEA